MANEFYLGFTPKPCDDRAILYQIMEAHLGDIWEFAKGPHLQAYVYDSMANVTMLTPTLSRQDDDFNNGIHVGYL